MLPGVLMAKKKENKGHSLEDRFIETLERNKLRFVSKLFNIGDKLYLPDFVFGKLIVEVEDCVSGTRVKTINKFRQFHKDYRVVLLTDDGLHSVEVAREFDEVFDFNSVSLLLSEIKKALE